MAPASEILSRTRIYDAFVPIYNGHRPRAVSIRGQSYPVKSWRSLFLKVCEVARDRRPSDFGSITKLRGKKAPWFSKSAADLRDPVEIDGTGIYTEANQNANALVLRCFHVLHYFGLEPMLKIDLAD